MLIIHVERTANPKKEREYVEDMLKMAVISRKEAGNISFTFYKDMEKAHVYGIIEVWENREAVDAHNETKQFRDFMKRSKAEKYTQGPPRVIVYDGEISPS